MSEHPTEQLEFPVEHETELDSANLAVAMGKLRAEQNLLGGLAAGTLAAILGAGLWAVVTVVTHYQIGWMAVGVGALVGITNRKIGKGIDPSFGIVGAALALLGCLLGNFFTVTYLVGQAEGMGFLEVLSKIKPIAVPELMMITFSPIDLLFYGIALYEGYKLSFRGVTHEQLELAIEEASAPI